ncbi:MAG: S8 family serine peptidase [Acidobacteria bacterium]|nr:S8 family serine peptidase [Acidobacteriota bacterium]NIM60400.1 S8 family serine peptidase [Acidobacteriota bacterium]NIO58575.1 S8 family serine peptidase [Acidobacteriota bacterium]NIQ29627.1 S8 family serine peptidase [Acidobacteriota bacterium]NIQ84344.1 S8 family serine peptidase [Acidobacteriota bacterium]
MRLRRTCLLPGILFAALTGVCLAADLPGEAWRDKIHPLLHEPSDDERVEFLIIMKDRADLAGAREIALKEDKTAFVVDRLREFASVSQAGVVRSLEARGAEVQPFWIVNALLVRADRGTLVEMARRNDVERIDPNPKTSIAAPETEASTRGPGMIEWNITLVGADQIWALGYDGTGIVIGSQDTGFFWDHPALINSYRGWDGVEANHDYNWHDAITSDAFASPTCAANAAAPCDDGYIFPHGTYTMGISVGDDGSTRQTGVAPGAKWMGCRNSDLLGGTPATYVECFQWLLAPTDLAGSNPDPALAPHVINNSWACIPAEGCNFDTLQATIDAVRAAGIVVVAAGGNDGNACATVQYPPAIYDASLTVGATDIVDVIGAISSRGPVTIDGSGRMKPDLVAPGISVTSAVGIWDLYTGGVDFSYYTASGTSASAPHVTGAIALLLQARPDLIGNVDAIEDLLRSTALPFTSNQPCGGLGPTDSPNHVYGHGRLDLPSLFLGDADMDGVANVYDCAMNDNTAWTLADPVTDLQVDGGSDTTLTWSQPTETGGMALSYDVLRTTLAGDLAGSTCVVSGQSATSAADATMPGEAFYYVVQTVNPCGPNAGSDSDGGLRDSTPCP